MVEFIAQMIEYNETLILYQIFIEKIDFFQLFFFDPGDLRDHPGVGYRGLSGTENSMKNDCFNKAFSKMSQKHRKSILTPLSWMNFFADSKSGIEKIQNIFLKMKKT